MTYFVKYSLKVKEFFIVHYNWRALPGENQFAGPITLLQRAALRTFLLQHAQDNTQQPDLASKLLIAKWLFVSVIDSFT
jgi:hypothetical protein